MRSANFVKEMVAILRDLGWTQKEIADEIGVGQGTVSRAVQGSQVMRRASVDKLLALIEQQGLRIKAVRERFLQVTEGGLE